MEIPLSQAETERQRGPLLCLIIMIGRSDLDPELTQEYLNERILASFDTLRAAFKEEIYEKIRKVLLNNTPSVKAFSAEVNVETNGLCISSEYSTFGSAFFRNNPCELTVIQGSIHVENV